MNDMEEEQNKAAEEHEKTVAELKKKIGWMEKVCWREGEGESIHFTW